MIKYNGCNFTYVSSTGNGILIVNRRRDAYTGPSVQGPNNSHPNVLFGAGEFVLTNTKIHAGAFSAVGGRQEIRLRRAQPTQSQRTGNPSKLDSRGSMSFLFLIEMKMFCSRELQSFRSLSI